MQGLEDPEAVGEDYNVEEADDGPRPFTALLDTGLKRTSTGSKVFAALKVRGSATLIMDCPDSGTSSQLHIHESNALRSLEHALICLFGGDSEQLLATRYVVSMQ